MSTAPATRLYCDAAYPGCAERVWLLGGAPKSLPDGWVDIGRDWHFCPNCAAKTSPAELVYAAREWAKS